MNLRPRTPGGALKLHYEIVTKGGAVIHTSEEEYPTIRAAAEKAQEWMDMKGATMLVDTYEGGAAVLRLDEVEHIAVLTPEQAAHQHAALFGDPTEDGAAGEAQP